MPIDLSSGSAYIFQKTDYNLTLEPRLSTEQVNAKKQGEKMKKLRMFLMSLCILGVFSLFGCSTTRSLTLLQNLEIGMDKNQVIKVAGDPDAARGAKKDDTGKVVEVWTYNLTRPSGCKRRMTPYMLRFEDNKLAQWGQERDWLRQPDKVETLIHERASQRNKEALY